MKERACTFGPELNLVGILSEPAEAVARPHAPIVLMLNAGLVHRVGPNQMSVVLARRLAALGISSLRLDLGGRGDSDPGQRTGSDEERVLADIGDAMDYLERSCKAHRFVLFGLCAGADNAHAAAMRDRRIVGAVLLDGHGYRTLGYYLTHYGSRILRLSAWRNLLRRVLQPTRWAADDEGEHGRRRPFGRRLDVEREVQSLVDRGVQLLYIYTGGVADYYNYPGQFADMFDRLETRGAIESVHFANADHLYTFREDRERMLARVLDWCGSRQWDPV